MDTITVLISIIAFIVIAGLVVTIFRISKKSDAGNNHLLFQNLENLRRELSEMAGVNRQEMQTRLDGMHTELRKGITFSHQTMQEQFRQSSQIITEITNRLTKIDSTNQQVLGFAQQMESIEKILKNPKHRGILGEYFLENMLSNVLQPNQYKMQYPFKNGEIVDAVIWFKEIIIPIDAKFSLEKYSRMLETDNETERTRLEKDFRTDLKNRIDETSKYIRPSEGTVDFAIMYIPAEGVYYKLLTYTVGAMETSAIDLREYAYRKKVVITSPTTFYAYLQTVLQGLKVVQTEKNIEQVIKKIYDLHRHLQNYQEFFQKTGQHLSTTVSMYNKASKEFTKIDKDINKITDGGVGEKVLEAPLVDKPEGE